MALTEKRRLYQKAWRALNVQKQKEYRKRGYAKNREAILEHKNAYNAQNREKIRLQNRTYYARNIQEMRERNKSYREAHKEDILNRKKSYNQSRYKSDPNYRLSINLRSRLLHAIRNGQKRGSAVRDLGCSIEELKTYLESKFQEGMTWENWGMNGWHIDHRRPLASFDLSNRDEFLKAVHYTNLQPLWATLNLKKGASVVYIEKFKPVPTWHDAVPSLDRGVSMLS